MPLFRAVRRLRRDMTMRRIMQAMTALAAGWMGVVAAALGADDRAPIEFSRDVRPILSKNCFACHGADDEQRKAGLRLDQSEAALKELESGVAAIVPRNVDESELYRRIASDDASERMPPKNSGRALTAAEIATLKRWIEEGAAYSEHWSFVKPIRPGLPAVRQAGWPRNGIDHFILARLERAGLAPSPEADRYTLIRRLSLDLRGLPPSPKEVDEFIRDSSPDAYGRLVDRMMADVAFGERWARMWLDLARYADSKGLGSDPLRTIWRYRDWVIDAFNANLPFDRFTAEQIAGDLLPQATLDQRIATAFHRNTMTNTEGGTDDEEFRVAAVKDRVDTTMQVWMGLTMGCAKCHNHKFDPLSQAEYYQFFAIFNQTADNDQPDESPVMPAPTAAIAERLKEIEGRIAQFKTQADTPTPQLAAEQEEWESLLRVEPSWTVLEPTALTAESGATFKKLDDESILAEGAAAANDVYTFVARTNLKGLTAFRLEALPDTSLPQGGSGRAPDGNFVLSRFGATIEDAEKSGAPVRGRFVRVELPGDTKLLSLGEVQVFEGADNVARAGKATQSSTDFGGEPGRAIDGNTSGDYFAAMSTTHTKTEKSPWWEVDLGAEKPIDRVAVWNRTDGGLGARLANFKVLVLDKDRKTVWQEDVAAAPNPSAELAAAARLGIPLAKAVADFSQKDFAVANSLAQKDVTQSGWAVAPEQGGPHSAWFIAAAPANDFSAALVTIKLEQRYKLPQHLLGRFRLAATTSPDVLRRVSVPAEFLEVVGLPAGRRTDDQRSKLAAYFRSIAPSLKPLRDAIAQLEKSRPEVPTVPVMAELPADKRRATHIMTKGNFLTPGAAVEPAVPAKFHPLAQGAAADRVSLARWLVDRDNPLTSRVMVNRFWAQLFGTGLVETEEDFGTQGELPTHPELLDWLAVEFMEPAPDSKSGGSGAAALPWDMKRLLNLIVTSATYRQSSQLSPEALARDPHNRLLTRGPRYRLEAEMVRDQALALSGLLSHK